MKSKRINDAYFKRLQDLSKNPQLELRLRFMVQNIIDLRSDGWVPRREEVSLAFKLSRFIKSYFIV